MISSYFRHDDNELAIQQDKDKKKDKRKIKER